MIVIRNPNVSNDLQREFERSVGSGTCSQIHFGHSDFWRGIDVMFHTRDNEQVIGVVIDEHTIKAQFKMKA